MEYNQNIRLSIKDHLQTLLVSQGFANVYGEREFRLVAAGNFTTGSAPVFLVDSFVKPTETTLPFVVLEIAGINRVIFEMGNDGDASEVFTYVHIFGRSRGQRDDIASYMQRHIGRGIPFNDYTTGSPVPYAYPIFRQGESVDVSYAPPVRDQQIQEGSLTNWTILSFKSFTLA